jgi:hypothetical protein
LIIRIPKRADYMARPTPQTQAKRRRELSKKEKRKAKEERRALRKEQKAQGREDSVPAGEDPDIFGIVPGPQPPPE